MSVTLILIIEVSTYRGVSSTRQNQMGKVKKKILEKHYL